MKKGQIVKVKLHNNTYYGIMLDDSELITEKAIVTKVEWAEVSNTRNVDPEIRTLLEKLMKVRLSQAKLEKQVSELNKQIYELKQEQTKLSGAIVKAKGLVTKTEFVEMIKSNMDKQILDCLNTAKYEIAIYGDQLIIERFADIEKWYHGAMFYERYDHTTTLSTGTKEAKAEYDFYIKKYSIPVNLKGQYKSYLSLGDKDWLSICEKYSYKLIKPLSKDYAEQIAKQL